MSINGFSQTRTDRDGIHRVSTDIDRAGVNATGQETVDISFFEHWSDDERLQHPTEPVKQHISCIMTQDEWEWFVECVYTETGWKPLGD